MTDPSEAPLVKVKKPADAREGVATSSLLGVFGWHGMLLAGIAVWVATSSTAQQEPGHRCFGLGCMSERDAAELAIVYLLGPTFLVSALVSLLAIWFVVGSVRSRLAAAIIPNLAGAVPALLIFAVVVS